ncbi:MAG: hypothetical protein JRH20_19985 [Deltaproteobacteria bacterium]|nr:hypothetical protein [Deltaproteobacteria bacterium]
MSDESQKEPTPTPLAAPSNLRRFGIPLVIYMIVLGGYFGAASNRLKKHSGDNHYVYLAQSLLQGRLSLKGAPPHQNDWARVLELELRDGRTVRGTYLRTGRNRTFKTTQGEKLDIQPSQVKKQKVTYYVSFPWFPALLMLPFVAIWGMKFNDVIFTAMLAAFNPVLLYWILGKLRALGYSKRSLQDDLWLVALFAFGTVHFFSAVLGQVWYTAHMVGVMITALYLLAALEGRHPWLAGLLLGLGFVTRTPIAFSVPLIVGEILRQHLTPRDPSSEEAGSEEAGSEEAGPLEKLREFWRRLDARPALVQLTKAGIPAVAVAGLAMVLNVLRFERATEFGHTFLNVKWAERIQRWGLFNFHFLSRNLSVMLTLLPRILAKSPFIKIPWHGVGLPVTTPLFVSLLWPKRKSPLSPSLYLSVLFPMVLHLLYQNSGWVQFGYRFSLDYTIYLMALLAIVGPRLGIFAKGLILWSVGVNTFGAVTYYRYWQYYWDGMFPTK